MSTYKLWFNLPPIIFHSAFFTYVLRYFFSPRLCIFQTLFFSLVNSNLPISTNFNPHKPTSRTSTENTHFNQLLLISIHFNELQSTSHYFNQLLPIIKKKKKPFNQLQQKNTYFNSFLSISIKFIHLLIHIFQRKEYALSVRRKGFFLVILCKGDNSSIWTTETWAYLQMGWVRTTCNNSQGLCLQ